MEAMARLQFNPGPLKVVESRRGDAAATRPWRCEWEDRRGRCSSLNTKGVVIGKRKVRVAYYCARHLKSIDVLA